MRVLLWRTLIWRNFWFWKSPNRNRNKTGIKIIVKSRKERYEKKSDYDLNGNLVFKSWKNFMVTDKKKLWLKMLKKPRWCFEYLSNKLSSEDIGGWYWSSLTPEYIFWRAIPSAVHILWDNWQLLSGKFRIFVLVQWQQLH